MMMMMMMMMMMVHMFANVYTYSTYVCIFINIEISNKNILFQDVIRKGVIRKGVKSQIPITGDPFVILDTKRLDCTHGVDRSSSKKKKIHRKQNRKG